KVPQRTDSTWHFAAVPAVIRHSCILLSPRSSPCHRFASRDTARGYGDSQRRSLPDLTVASVLPRGTEESGRRIVRRVAAVSDGKPEMDSGMDRIGGQRVL